MTRLLTDPVSGLDAIGDVRLVRRSPKGEGGIAGGK